MINTMRGMDAMLGNGAMPTGDGVPSDGLRHMGPAVYIADSIRKTRWRKVGPIADSLTVIVMPLRFLR